MLLECGFRQLVSIVASVCLLAGGCTSSPRTNVVEHIESAPPVVLYRQTTRADEFGRLIVPVELNSQGPFYFLLDTGAARSVLTETALDRLGMRVDERHDVFVRGVSGRTRVHTAVLDSLKVGDIEVRAQRFPVLKSRLVEGLDGILSADRLRDLHLTADFANAEVRIMNNASRDLSSNSLPMRFTELSRQLIVVQARIGKHRVPAIIDTGGAHTLGNVALLNKLIADAGGVLDGVIMSRVADATDTVLDTWDSRVKTMNLGEVAVDDLRVSFGRFPVFEYWGFRDTPALLIGMDVLGRTQSISIDYRRRRMALAAREMADQPQP
jgi:predicted aspartyl protease